MLSDGEKRKAYDTYGHAGLGGGGGGGGPGQGFGQGFHPGGGGFQWRSDNPNVDLNDIFEQLFGGQGRRQRGPRRGRDVQTQIVLDLEEVSETLPRHFRETSERVPRDCAARETRREMCHAVCRPLLPHPHTLCQAKSPATSPATHLTTTPPHHHHGHHRHTATPPPHDTVHTTVHTTPSTRHARPQVAVGVEKSVSWRTAEGTETAEVRLSRCGRCAPVLERALEGARARLRSVSAAAACAV